MSRTPFASNNRHPINSSTASDPDLDRLLTQHFSAPDEQLTPSSGFVLSVMDTIHEHAAEPPPLAFPWSRILPGAIAILGALLAFVYAWIRHSRGTMHSAIPAAHQELFSLPHLMQSPTSLALCWSALAICLSIAAATAAFRLTNSDS